MAEIQINNQTQNSDQPDQTGFQSPLNGGGGKKTLGLVLLLILLLAVAAAVYNLVVKKGKNQQNQQPAQVTPVEIITTGKLVLPEGIGNEILVDKSPMVLKNNYVGNNQINLTYQASGNVEDSYKQYAQYFTDNSWAVSDWKPILPKLPAGTKLPPAPKYQKSFQASKGNILVQFTISAESQSEAAMVEETAIKL